MRGPMRTLRTRTLPLCGLAPVLLLAIPLPAPAQVLGTADSFAVLGAAAVTNTGPSVLWGELGVSPAGAISGFPPGLVSHGTKHVNDAVAAQAQADVLTAYNTIAGEAKTADLTGQDL